MNRAYFLPLLMWWHVVIYTVLLVKTGWLYIAFFDGFSLSSAIFMTAWIHRDQRRVRV